jgi:ubiquinone/menaquinone biosynthesis C-methylase UbiE
LKLNTNAWNRARYTFWAPFYDRLIRPFAPMRRRSLARLQPLARERVLLVGAGTGSDLDHLPPGAWVLATDLTESMLRRAAGRGGPDVHLAVMDGHRLAVRDATFDAAALHLIVAVIPDPVRLLGEVARVVRPGGRVVVMDKFSRERRPSLALRALNVVASPLFTEMTRNLPALLEQAKAPLAIETDEPAAFGGLFRVVLLRRTRER